MSSLEHDRGSDGKGAAKKEIMEAKIMGQPAALRTPIEYAFLEGIGIL